MMPSKAFVFRFEDVEVRERELTIIKAGEVLPVEPKAFRVLLFLLNNPQKLITKEELLDAVWADAAVTESSLTRSIAKLRRVLGDDFQEPRYIATVATVGYRFVCDVEISEDSASVLNAPNNPNGLNWNGVAESSPVKPVAENAAVILSPNGKDAETEEARIKLPRLSRRRPWLILSVCAAGLLVSTVFVYLRTTGGPNMGRYKFTPIATDIICGMWSPDGKSIAYIAKANGTYQLFLRFLNSPVSMQLTHHEGSQMVGLDGFSSDGAHVLFGMAQDNGQPGLYSVATVGGEPEFIGDRSNWPYNVSRDGKVLVVFKKGTNNLFGVEVSDPIGSPPHTYEPAPFAAGDVVNMAQIGLSPDGKKILLFFEPTKGGAESWLLPYPAGSQAPRRLPQKMSGFQGTPRFSWMPDSRHFVVSFAEDQNSPSHLWMADTESADLVPLTIGATDEFGPNVAPDGRSLLYFPRKFDADVVSISVEDGSGSTLISSGRFESMPSQSSNQGKLAWVSNRNGPFEVWVRGSDRAEHPAVTGADFPAGTNRWFIAPAISPDGQRVIYQRVDSQGVSRLWVSALAGGNPIRLTNVESEGEDNGSWSPDGNRFVYLQREGGKYALMLVRTNGSASPTLLRDSVGEYIPDWSPVGDGITFRDNHGWHVISPDGKSEKFLGKLKTAYLASSKDGKLLYGILTSENVLDQVHAALFSIDPVTLRQKTIKELSRDLVPGSNFDPGIRFSLAPDGKSIVYSIRKDSVDLWMLEGLRQPNWLDRVRSWVSK